MRQLLAFSVESEDANSPKAALSVRSNSALGDIFTRGDANRLDIKEQLFKSTDFKFFLPKEELRSRISYLGQVSDEAMPQFYAALDYVVHPYIKTRSGQSGSGPATLAIEFGARSLFTNVPVFREMSEYFKDAMAFFNVGNFIELSEALTRFDGIENEISVNRKKALATYNPAGMIDAYRNLIEA